MFWPGADVREEVEVVACAGYEGQAAGDGLCSRIYDRIAQDAAGLALVGELCRHLRRSDLRWRMSRFVAGEKCESAEECEGKGHGFEQR